MQTLSPRLFSCFLFRMLVILACSHNDRMYCGLCLGNERANCRKWMLCDGLLSCLSPSSRSSCHRQTHHPRRSLLSFITSLTTRIHTRPWVQISQRLWVCLSSESPPRNTNVVTGKMFGNKEMRLLMLGLDAAGKTSTHPRFSGVGMF